MPVWSSTRMGRIHGATHYGGVVNSNCPDGCGTFFKITGPPSPGGSSRFNVIYQFGGGDGSGPQATLIVGPGGELYGTAFGFAGAPDGATPHADGLVMSPGDGALLGATPSGGDRICNCGHAVQIDAASNPRRCVADDRIAYVFTVVIPAACPTIRRPWAITGTVWHNSVGWWWYFYRMLRHGIPIETVIPLREYILPPIGGATRIGFPNAHLSQLHGRALPEPAADLVVEVFGDVLGGGIQHVEGRQIV